MIQPVRSSVVLVTGMSGAGRSFALKTLEDMGYETVDNLPLSLLSLIVNPSTTLSHPMAIGIDVRTRDFSSERFLSQIHSLGQREDLKIDIIFCDCDDEVLAQRYTETRRRHPLADERPAIEGIRTERLILKRILDEVTFILDTTQLSIIETRQILRHRFSLELENKLFIQVLSFAFKRGIPRESDVIYDVRFLKNAYYDPALRHQSGRDAPVADFIRQDLLTEPFLQHVKDTLTLMLPRFDGEGRSYLTLAFGCTGGQHRSVFCAETIFSWLGLQRKNIALRHRDMVTLPNHPV